MARTCTLHGHAPARLLRHRRAHHLRLPALRALALLPAVELRLLLGLLLRYYAGDAAAGKAGFEVDFEGGPAHHDEGRAGQGQPPLS